MASSTLGNDTVTGGAGDDVFVFKGGFGHDIITDFNAGAGSIDVIDTDAFDATITSLSAPITGYRLSLLLQLQRLVRQDYEVAV